MSHDDQCIGAGTSPDFHHKGVCDCLRVERIRADERAKAPTHATGTSTGDGPCCQCCYDVPVLRNDHRIARRRVKQLVDERDALRAKVEELTSWEVAGIELLSRTDVLALLPKEAKR